MTGQPFELYVADINDAARVWCVRQAGEKHFAGEVVLNVPTQTVWHGVHANAPRAVLVGVGVLERRGDVLLLHE